MSLVALALGLAGALLVHASSVADGVDGEGPGSSSAAGRGALLSMASKDRAAALSLPPAPERALGWLLGGRDGRLLLVAVGAALGAPADGRVG